MIELEGTFYLGGSTHCFNARVLLMENGQFKTSFDDRSIEYSSNEYTIEPKLGNSNRIIHFDDGAKFETSDHERFDRFEQSQPGQGLLDLVAKLEGKWRWAIASFATAILFCFLFLVYGVPVIAKYIAFEVPQGVRTALSDNTMELMDKYMMDDSSSMDLITKGNEAFTETLALVGDDLNPDFQYKLRVYKAPGLGANAFALPSGTIVATEELLELCTDQDQVVAIFLHEICHVQHQHGIRSVLQDAGVFLIVSIAFGDLSAVGGMAASFPSLLIESRYSQAFENESDAYAARILMDNGYGISPMKDALILLYSQAPDIEIAEFLSTHPTIRKRLELLDELAASAN